MLISIVGAVIGGYIAVQFGLSDISGFDFRSLVIAIIGGLVLLFGYRLLKKT